MANKISYKEFYNEYENLCEKYKSIAQSKELEALDLYIKIIENKEDIQLVEEISDDEYRLLLRTLFVERAKANIVTDISKKPIEHTSFVLPEFKDSGSQQEYSFKKYNKPYKLSERLNTSNFYDNNSLDSLVNDYHNQSNIVEIMAREYCAELYERRFQDLRKGQLKPWSYYFQNQDDSIEKPDVKEFISYSSFAAKHEMVCMKISVEKQNGGEVDDKLMADFFKNNTIFHAIEDIDSQNYLKFLKKALTTQLRATNLSYFEHKFSKGPCFLNFDLTTKDGSCINMAGEFSKKDNETLSNRNQNLCFAEVGTGMMDRVEKYNASVVERAVFNYHKQICEQRWQDFNRGALKSWDYYLDDNIQFE